MSKVVNKVEDLEGEIWRPVVGYEGYYEVSNLGRVKSWPKKWKLRTGGITGHNGMILKPGNTSNGYKYVCLRILGEAKNHSVHRLVAMSFIDNSENKPQVNHKNGIKTDNRVENLEWVTSSENQLHAYKNGLNYGNKSITGGLNPNAKMVKDKKTGKIYHCIMEAAKINNMNATVLGLKLNGKRKNNTPFIYC